MADPRRAGKEYKPEDYLAAFARFVKENPAADRGDRHPAGPAAGLEHRGPDGTAREAGDSARSGSPIENLQKAHELSYHKALVDIISMVKHAAEKRSRC